MFSSPRFFYLCLLYETNMDLGEKDSLLLYNRLLCSNIIGEMCVFGTFTIQNEENKAAWIRAGRLIELINWNLLC